MRIVTRIADKMLNRVAPKATADASTVVLGCSPCGDPKYCVRCNGGPCMCAN